MTVYLGKNKIGSDIIKIKDVFDEDFINFLYNECQQQLKYNLLSDNCVLSSKCIIDCHGLVVCGEKTIKHDPIFPYSIKNWNIFCIKMRNIIYSYCDEFNLDKSYIIPHSCWVERSLIGKPPFVEIKINDNDKWLNSFCNNGNPLNHYRVVYFLKNLNSEFGVTILDGKYKTNLLGEENSLYVIPTSNYNCYTKFSTTDNEQFVLMFDWYLHPKYSRNYPTWAFPNKYNDKLFKNYIKMLKKKFDKKTT